MVRSPRRSGAVGPLGLFVAGCLVWALPGCDEPSGASPIGTRLAGSGGGETIVDPLVKPTPAPLPLEPAPLPEPEDPSTALDEVQVQVLSSSMAKVSWKTAERADAEVRWGRSAALEGTPVLQPEAARYHCVLLNGLQPETEYQFVAQSRNRAGTTVASTPMAFSTLPLERPTIRRDHPRLLFNTDDLPELARRIRTTHARDWEGLLQACRSALGKTTAALAASSNNYQYARALAFAGLLGEDPTLRQKALEVALECARLGLSGGVMDVRRRILTISAVYDWNYASIPTGPRGVLRSALREMVDHLEGYTNEREFVWGHSHGHQRPMLLAMLALFGDVPEAEEKVAKLAKDAREGYLATWRNYAENGGSLKGWWYTTWTLNMEVEFLASLKSATDVEAFRGEDWFRDLVDWYLLGLRGDGTLCRSGDGRIYDGLNPFDRIYALCVVHNFGSAEASWLARKVEEQSGRWTLLNFYDILWNDPDVEPEPPRGERRRLFRAPGQVVLRSSWESDAVVATFRCASDYTLGHTHRDNNSFTIFYRGGLAIDSGIYDEYAGSHHLNYYSRTIAHNSVLVYDPEEEFRFYGKLAVNDGGQRWLAAGKDVPASIPAHVEQTLDPSFGYSTSGIVIHESTREYTYSVGDAASSYSSSKLRRFDRHLLWLEDVEGAGLPAIVVLDRIESTSPSYKKTYLLHTVGQPSVFQNVVVAENGGGVLHQQTLLPENPSIRVIGGPGAEFWVQGANRAPSRRPDANEEAGSYRVEVSPSVSRADDVFLHVLYASDPGSRPPQASTIPADGAIGMQVAAWTVLIAVDRGAIAIRYECSSRSPRHLVAGLVPTAVYEVLINRVLTDRIRASDNGLVRFDCPTGGSVQLRRFEESTGLD